MQVGRGPALLLGNGKWLIHSLLLHSALLGYL